jgi:hypothetical protein
LTRIGRDLPLFDSARRPAVTGGDISGPAHGEDCSVQTPATAAIFSDRRQAPAGNGHAGNGHAGNGHAGPERRQFGNSYDSLSAPARELAERIDQYKLHNHRRFITYEELYEVIESLGYQRP